MNLSCRLKCWHHGTGRMLGFGLIAMTLLNACGTSTPTSPIPQPTSEGETATVATAEPPILTATPPVSTPNPTSEFSRSPAPEVQATTNTLVIIGIDDSKSMGESCDPKTDRYNAVKALLNLARQYWAFVGDKSVEVQVVSFPSKTVVLPQTNLSEVTAGDIEKLDQPARLSKEPLIFDTTFSYLQSVTETKKTLILFTDGKFSLSSSPTYTDTAKQVKNRNDANTALVGTLTNDIDIAIYPVLLCWRELVNDDISWWAAIPNRPDLNGQGFTYKATWIVPEQGSIEIAAAIWQDVFAPLSPYFLANSLWGGVYLVRANEYLNLSTADTGALKPCPADGKLHCLPVNFTPNVSHFSAGAVNFSVEPFLIKVNQPDAQISSVTDGSSWKWDQGVLPTSECQKHQWFLKVDMQEAEAALFWWLARPASLGGLTASIHTNELVYYGDHELDVTRARTITATVSIPDDLQSFAPCYQINLWANKTRLASIPLTNTNPVWAVDNQFELPASARVSVTATISYIGYRDSQYDLQEGADVTITPTYLHVKHIPGLVKYEPCTSSNTRDGWDMCSFTLRYAHSEYRDEDPTVPRRPWLILDGQEGNNCTTGSFRIFSKDDSESQTIDIEITEQSPTDTEYTIFLKASKVSKNGCTTNRLKLFWVRSERDDLTRAEVEEEHQRTPPENRPLAWECPFASGDACTPVK